MAKRLDGVVLRELRVRPIRDAEAEALREPQIGHDLGQKRIAVVGVSRTSHRPRVEGADVAPDMPSVGGRFLAFHQVGFEVRHPRLPGRLNSDWPLG